MRKSEKLFYWMFLSGLSVIALPAHANVFQYFFGSNYKNPAELSTIPRAEITAGVTGVNPVLEFKGVSGGGSGTASSDETDALPYFFGGFRLSPKWVVGLNISRPFYGNSQYPEDSIIRFDSTQTIIKDTDISPQISYQLTKSLALGAGYNFNYFHDDVNFVIPGIGNVRDDASGWYHGWDAGLFYTLTPMDYISLAYFSGLHATTLTGTSKGGNLINNNLQVAELNLPATTVFNYIHIFNQQWSMSFKAMFSQWNTLENMITRNIVIYGNFAVPVHYHNTFAGQIGARYAFAPDWAVLGGVGFDQAPSNNVSRTVAFPNDDAYAGALGLEHQFCKNLSANLMYTYAIADTHVNRPLGISPSVGDIDVHANILDLSFTYKI